MPTLSRLPGYPAFLAIIFWLFGDENYRAVLLVQVLFDLATCFLIADMARRFFGGRAAQAAFLLAAICPFLANYAAAALTETLEIFFTALALRSRPLRPESERHDAESGSSPHRVVGMGVARMRTLRWGRHPAAARRRDLTRRYRRISALAFGTQPVPPHQQRACPVPPVQSFGPESCSPSERLRHWSPGPCATFIPCTASSLWLRAMPTIPTNW